MISVGNIFSISVLNLYLNFGPKCTYCHVEYDDDKLMLKDLKNNFIINDAKLAKITAIDCTTVTLQSINDGAIFKLTHNEFEYAMIKHKVIDSTDFPGMLKSENPGILQTGQLVQIDLAPLGGTSSNKTGITKIAATYGIVVRHAIISNTKELLHQYDFITHDEISISSSLDIPNVHEYMIRDIVTGNCEIDKNYIALQNFYVPKAIAKFSPYEFGKIVRKVITT